VSQKKRGVELFAITSSTVNHFENSFAVGNSNKLSINKYNISRHFLKTLLHYREKHKSYS